MRLSIDPEQVTDLIITHMIGTCRGRRPLPESANLDSKKEYDQTVDASEKMASKDGRPFLDHVAHSRHSRVKGASTLLTATPRRSSPE